jgi:hypothetical protein
VKAAGGRIGDPVATRRKASPPTRATEGHDPFGSGETVVVGRARWTPTWEGSTQRRVLMGVGLIALAVIVASVLASRPTSEGTDAAIGTRPGPSVAEWAVDAQAACDTVVSRLPSHTAPDLHRDGAGRTIAGAYGVLAASLKELTPPVSDVEEVGEWIASIEYLARFHEVAAQAADLRDLDGHSAAVRSIDGEVGVAR